MDVTEENPYAYPRCEICTHAQWGGTCDLPTRPVKWDPHREARYWPVTAYSDLCDQYALNQAALDHITDRNL